MSAPSFEIALTGRLVDGAYAASPYVVEDLLDSYFVVVEVAPEPVVGGGRLPARVQHRCPRRAPKREVLIAEPLVYRLTAHPATLTVTKRLEAEAVRLVLAAAGAELVGDGRASMARRLQAIVHHLRVIRAEMAEPEPDPLQDIVHQVYLQRVAADPLSPPSDFDPMRVPRRLQEHPFADPFAEEDPIT